MPSNKTGETDLVALGAVARPHGVRGEVRVFRYNEDSRLMDSLERVILRRDGELRPVRVLSSRPHGKLLLMTFRGTEGRDAAEALRGVEVCIPRDQLPPPDPDEFYHVDLIGLAAQRPDGIQVGTVSDVIRYPSADCLVLQVPGGVLEVPLLRPYVVDVDVAGGTVVVDHLDDFDVRGAKR